MGPGERDQMESESDTFFFRNEKHTWDSHLQTLFTLFHNRGLEKFLELYILNTKCHYKIHISWIVTL